MSEAEKLVKTFYAEYGPKDSKRVDRMTKEFLTKFTTMDEVQQALDKRVAGQEKLREDVKDHFEKYAPKEVGNVKKITREFYKRKALMWIDVFMKSGQQLLDEDFTIDETPIMKGDEIEDEILKSGMFIKKSGGDITAKGHKRRSSLGSINQSEEERLFILTKDCLYYAKEAKGKEGQGDVKSADIKGQIYLQGARLVMPAKDILNVIARWRKAGGKLEGLRNFPLKIAEEGANVADWARKMSEAIQSEHNMVNKMGAMVIGIDDTGEIAKRRAQSVLVDGDGTIDDEDY